MLISVPSSPLHLILPLCCASLREVFSNYEETGLINDWITPVQVAGWTGMIPANYHSVTVLYQLVWRLEETFANILV